MDITMLVLVPGIIGGFVLALLLFRLQAPPSSTDPFNREALSTDIINIAHIRVAGVGGLGLVAMALVVAWFLPRVWQHVAVGAVLGVVLAAVLIIVRRR
jgi:hypothetical protein